MLKQKTYLNWSSGKDAALALYYLLKDPNYEVEYILTTVNAHYNRVSMHGLRRDLLEQQLQSIGIANGVVALPETPSNNDYEELMGRTVRQLKTDGFEYAAFGDIFLDDLRTYREQQLEKVGVKTVFPLWKKDTGQLIHEFLDKGFKTIVVCVNADLLDASFAGRIIDEDFINDLPEGVDPCGENGEFHTFCFDAPYFECPVRFTIGEKVYKEYKNGGTTNGFWFCDLLPINKNE
ncbi:diphthine--ammonia ligase [Maribacter sp. ANRC-HE7]|uniref:Diphthine--ammonia ligase n=2 Tax=Maribacter aquimaris TaxID=2737171 RepID=A0ABR7V1Q8_9FLAO|nr:diphthine--ammonia ligase [Maribacter aquimaris]